MKTVKDRMEIVMGNIVEEESDAIVNAANEKLLGGGGVDGAIHSAAGPELLEECKKFNGCKPGEAVITEGYKLKSKYIIHTPGPVYIDGKHDEKEILKKSYENSLKIAIERNLKQVSFPAISTGIYGYPKEEACEIAIKTVVKFLEKRCFDCKIRFVLFDSENYYIYKNELRKYL